MKIRVFISAFILIALASCSLFDTPVFKRDEILKSGQIYSDSITFENAATYSIYLSSDYSLDVFFFDSKEGYELFRDSGMLYSEYIYQPLSYANKTYVDEVFQIFEDNKRLYFVIDNRDYVSASGGDALYSFEIKKL